MFRIFNYYFIILVAENNIVLNVIGQPWPSFEILPLGRRSSLDWLSRTLSSESGTRSQDETPSLAGQKCTKPWTAKGTPFILLCK